MSVRAKSRPLSTSLLDFARSDKSHSKKYKLKLAY